MVRDREGQKAKSEIYHSIRTLLAAAACFTVIFYDYLLESAYSTFKKSPINNSVKAVQTILSKEKQKKDFDMFKYKNHCDICGKDNVVGKILHCQHFVSFTNITI